MRSAKRSDPTRSQRAPSPRSTNSMASIAAFLSASVCFRENSKLVGAAYAAPHQDQPTKPNGYPDDHPNRRDGRQTDHQTNKRRWAGEGASASCYDEPAAAPDRLSQLICASSRSACSAGVGSASNIELSAGVAGRSNQELAAIRPQNRRSNAKTIDMPN